jgi:hypothetical protein
MRCFAHLPGLTKNQQRLWGLWSVRALAREPAMVWVRGLDSALVLGQEQEQEQVPVPVPVPGQAMELAQGWWPVRDWAKRPGQALVPG